MGEDLLDPPNVKGWKGGSSWISTQSMLARRQVLAQICDGALGGVHDAHRDAPPRRAGAGAMGAMAPRDAMAATAAPAAAAGPIATMGATWSWRRQVATAERRR